MSRGIVRGNIGGSRVQIPVQDYQSLHAAVMICATPVNTHTQPLIISSAS